MPLSRTLCNPEASEYRGSEREKRERRARFSQILRLSVTVARVYANVVESRSHEIRGEEIYPLITLETRVIKTGLNSFAYLTE